MVGLKGKKLWWKIKLGKITLWWLYSETNEKSQLNSSNFSTLFLNLQAFLAFEVVFFFEHFHEETLNTARRLFMKTWPEFSVDTNKIRSVFSENILLCPSSFKLSRKLLDEIENFHVFLLQTFFSVIFAWKDYYVRIFSFSLKMKSKTFCLFLTRFFSDSISQKH